MRQKTARAGTAYAFLHSKCCLGDLKRELAAMKDAPGRQGTIRINAYCANAVQSDKGKPAIPANLLNLGTGWANYAIKAELDQKPNETVAYELNSILGVRSDVLRPDELRIYFHDGKNFRIW